MHALVVDQRVRHTFHPYQNTSHTTSLASTNLSHLSCDLSRRTIVHKPLPPSNMELDCPVASQFARHTSQQLSDTSLDRRPVTAPGAATTQVVEQRQSLCPSSPSLITISLSNSWTGPAATHKSSSPARAPTPPRPIEDIISYLKTWRPPVEYYARRRYQHPSLSYPSRRPSLPALLEERITHDGAFDIVGPESARSAPGRVHLRRTLPKHLAFGHSTSQRAAQQGWDDESDEDLESEDADDDEDDWSETDSEEAVTPTNSPPSTSTYFLQPVILTKPPGC